MKTANKNSNTIKDEDWYLQLLRVTTLTHKVDCWLGITVHISKIILRNTYFIISNGSTEVGTYFPFHWYESIFSFHLEYRSNLTVSIYSAFLKEMSGSSIIAYTSLNVSKYVAYFWYQNSKIDTLRRVEIRDILPLGKKSPLFFKKIWEWLSLLLPIIHSYHRSISLQEKEVISIQKRLAYWEMNDLCALMNVSIDFL